MIDYAIIDIGSNSVRLMTMADGKVFYKVLITTRLGEGLAGSNLLKAESIERTARAVETLQQKAQADGAKAVYAFATAAVRSAKNGKDFVQRVDELCSLKVDVVSGEMEAELGAKGALGERDGALIDIGGASTELIVQKAGKIVYKKSVDVGAVRLKDVCGRQLNKLQSVCQEYAKQFHGAPVFGLDVYGVGGTATTLAAVLAGIKKYEQDVVTGVKISVENAKALSQKLTQMPVEEVEKIPCVDKKRADIIGGGATLLAAIMQEYNIPEVIASDSDNMEGYAKYLKVL